MMADYDPYGSDERAYARPRVTEAAQPAAVATSSTPTTANTGYTPPPNAGSWNSYYQQPGTTTASSSYGMNQNFQYQMPGGTNAGTAYGQTGSYANQLEGFNTDKLADPTHTSAKYQFARVASRYAPTQQGFAQLMADPDFQGLGMQSIGNGKIRLPNGDVIDVVRGFNTGGQAWQWGAETVNGQAEGQAQPAQQQDPWASYQQSQDAWTKQWQDYYQQIAAWQQQQALQQAPTQVWEQPSTPEPQPVQAQPTTGYYQAPQQVYAPDYGGYGYNQGVGLQGGGGGAVYGPSPYDPSGQAFGYLAQGMPSPYYYG